MLSHHPQDIAIGILIAHVNTVTNADVDIPPTMMKMTKDIKEKRNPLLRSLFNTDMKMETLKSISLVNHQKSLTIMFYIPKEHQSQLNLFLRNLPNQTLHLLLQSLNWFQRNHAK